MALKFFSVFKDYLDDEFKKAFSPGDIDMSGLKEASEELGIISKTAKQTADNIAKLESEFKALKITGQDTVKVEVKLNKEREIAKTISESEIVAKKKYNKESKTAIDQAKHEIVGKKQYYKTASNLEDEQQKQLDRYFKELESGTITIKDYKQEVSRMQSEFLKVSGFQAFRSSLSQGSESLMTFGKQAMGSVLDSTLKAIPGLGQFAGLLKDGLEAAIKQALELNSALIDLQRSTGGMVTSTALGTNAFGAFKDGSGSLKTAVLGANISMDQFSHAIQGLGDLSNTVGAQDVKNMGKSLSNFGVESARLSKLYGAEIGPSVAGLRKNFGLSMSDATKVMSDGAKSAQMLGISVAGFTKNFEEVVNLSGSVYFKTQDAMQNMATLATQLGVSVNSIAHGFVKMNGIIDLFTEQQKRAALGLGAFAKNASAIYALQKQGKGDQAAKLEATSLAKDLLSQGYLKGGQVTSQGIATLDAEGISDEGKKAIQNLARQAEKTGISFDKLGGTVKMTAEEQRKATQAEHENMKLTERFSVGFDKVIGTLIDPIMNIVTPVMEGFASIFEGIIDVVIPPLKFLGQLISTIASGPLTFIKTVFTKIGNAFSIVGEKLSGLFEKIQPAISWLSDKFSAVGSFLGDLVGGVFTVLGTVIGWLVDGISFLVDIVKSAWKIFDEYIIQPISNILGPVFEWIGDVMSDAIKPFQWLWEQLKAFGDWLAKWFGSDDTAKDTGANVNWEQLLGGKSETGNVELATPSTPKPELSVEDYAKAAVSSQTVENANLAGTNNSKTPVSVTVNTETNGMFNNKQTIRNRT